MSLERLARNYKETLAEFGDAHAKLRHNKAIMKRLGKVFKG